MLFKRILLLILLLTLPGLYLGGKIITIAGAADSNILTMPWYLSVNGTAERYQIVNTDAFKGADKVSITYDLHGHCLYGGDASAVIFDQNGWRYISLSQYGKNCFNGKQTVSVPISAFRNPETYEVLTTKQPITGFFHVRMWSDTYMIIDVYSVTLTSKSLIKTLTQTVSSTPVKKPASNTVTPKPSRNQTPTNTPVDKNSPTPTPKPAVLSTWSVQSVDAMKETKDTVCGQRTPDWIRMWVAKAKDIGANYIAISTPYDNPSCGNAETYTNTWITEIRAAGLHVWHRQMPLAFEGIYDVAKSRQSNFLDQIQQYIKNHPDMYREGDILTPIPEPQNGGIYGITYCANGVCQYSSKENFNKWLRDAVSVTKNALTTINQPKVKVGYFGFDGFIAWGDHNPDWNGILEDETIKVMGNITIDHYPEVLGETMAQGLDALEAKYPGIDIIVGEWGTVTGGDTVSQVDTTFTAASRPSVKGMNYWQFGPDGISERLILDDFSPNTQYGEVKKFFLHKQ